MLGIMNIEDHHDQIWRYSFNFEKCAVMVYSETNSEVNIRITCKIFTLRNDPVTDRLNTCVGLDLVPVSLYTSLFVS